MSQQPSPYAAAPGQPGAYGAPQQPGYEQPGQVGVGHGQHGLQQPGQQQPPGWQQQPPTQHVGWQQPGAEHGQQPGGWQQPQQSAGHQPGGWQQPQHSAGHQPGVDAFNPQPFGGGSSTSESVSSGGIRSNLGRIAVIATVVLIAVVGGFAVQRALSGPGGAETPEQAADMFFESLDNEDLLGLAEITVPSERESLIEPSTDVIIEMARLDLLAEDVVDGDGNVDDFSGLSFEIPAAGEPGALVYESTPISGREDLRWVTVTDGQIDVTYNPQEFRDGLGGRFSEWLDTAAADQNTTEQTETVDFGEAFLEGDPLEFAVVEEDGAFFVSLYYTIAGFATDRGDTILAPPPAPVGSDSPEQAAVDLLDNLVDLDAEGVLTVLDPREFRAAYDYWSHYSPDMVQALEQAKADAAAEGVSWDLVSARATAEDRNGRRVAVYDEVVFSVTSTNPEAPVDLLITLNGDGLVLTGSIQGGPVDLTITGTSILGSATIDGQVLAADFNLETYEGWYRIDDEVVTVTRQGDCLFVTSGADQETFCDEDLGFDGGNALLDFQESYSAAFAEAGRPGLTVVERDGRWYVAGYPTFAFLGVDYLKALDQDELNQLVEDYEELIESSLDGMTT